MTYSLFVFFLLKECFVLVTQILFCWVAGYNGCYFLWIDLCTKCTLRWQALFPMTLSVKLCEFFACK